MSPFDAVWTLLKNADEVQLCPSCQGVGFGGDNDLSGEAKCRSCFGTGLADKERYHPEDTTMPHNRDWPYSREKEIGNTVPKEQEGATGFSINPVRNTEDLLALRPNPIRMRTIQDEPSFMYTPFAGVGREMENPAAEIFRRSEPFDLAWAIVYQNSR